MINGHPMVSFKATSRDSWAYDPEYHIQKLYKLLVLFIYQIQSLQYNLHLYTKYVCITQILPFEFTVRSSI